MHYIENVHQNQPTLMLSHRLETGLLSVEQVMNACVAFVTRLKTMKNLCHRATALAQ